MHKSTPDKPKLKPGPKRIPIDLEAVEQAAAQGLGKHQIAMALGISHETFFKRIREDRESEEPTLEIVDAIKRGEAKGMLHVTSAIFHLAIGDAENRPNLGACIWYTKNRDPDNWKDRVETTTKHILETPAEQAARLAIENIKQVN